jgi:hypothetical protein
VLCMSAESMHAKTSLPLFPRVQAVLGCHTIEKSTNSGITELRTACRSIDVEQARMAASIGD